ncbi:PREDICTED: glucose dehydrogenase [FAD, quinone]-like [Atta colombica]|uniref:glucose dehydrogenase [FAD, quinone]-like n=1 Tax=Atta colombica TaxID=520822 RepID=UPI00084C350E|nr:PREDICTED: glucose dehydrogenase [FAD, quinone]-like [Atta colombica]
MISADFTNDFNEETKYSLYNFCSSTSPVTVPADGKTESTVSRDTDKLETPKKIYITTNEFPLPMMLEDINFFDQGYPIWIKNNPYRSWKVKDEEGWRYHAPQEPYKILLPPYEPVILVEDIGKRGQFLPFFTDAFFTDFFSEAASIPLPEITPADIGNSKVDNTSMITNETIDYTNISSTIAKIENIKTNHTDESLNDHRSSPITEKTSTASLNIHNKELDNSNMSCNCPLTTSAGPTLASTCGGSSFMLFMGLLEVFLRSQCDLEDPCNRPAPPSSVNTRYDFVVIGGGSAGATVAARLSEEPRFSVLLLEAGLDEPTGTQIPSFFFNFIGSDIDWQYTTESEDEACLNKEHKKCYWPRGKVLGGTSVMNGMMYMRGSRKDYDDWAKLGNVGWSYRDVLPFFIRSEDNQQVNSMDYGYHGIGGPLTVMQFPYHPPLSTSLLEAGKELGYDTVDLNGRTHTGFAIAQTTSRNGSRLSTARAFLRPARNRPNLHIMLNSTATKILFDENNRAVGVEFLHDGMMKHVSVAKEVIVSGGAVNSPQILLNSGIGSRDELNTVGVPVVRDLPGVGKNLHNHVAYALTFTINDTDTTPLNWATAMEYLLFRDGLMSGTGISEVTAMINTKYANPKEDHPDVQLIFGGYLADCAETGMVGEKKGANRSIYVIPTILHPKSRGYLRLRNNDPLSKPLIYPKYLTHPDDSAALVEAVKFSIRLTETQALKRYGFELDRTPVKNCEHLKFGCDAYWECAIRHDTAPENHQAGSCKMGPPDDPMAVVDNQLRVRGVRGVRVADTSIMPRVTSGNTNAPAIMIGERAADFIKKTWIG